MKAPDGFFDSAQPIVTGRAPGRLDVMGGIADYSGSLVLQLPTRAKAHVDVQWDAGEPPTVTVRTTDADAAGGASDVRVSLDVLLDAYDVVRARLAAEPSRVWSAYVAGAVTVLHHELGAAFGQGIRVHLASEVPAGRGVASSAAIEVAAMRALASLLDVPLAPRDLALLCQKVENLVVGAPCGVMDQMTAACGRSGALLALLCQPAELQPPVRIPDGVAFFGVDSGIRHAVSGADYGSVRIGTFMGYRIIAETAGLRVDVKDRHAIVDDPRWRGYVANVTVEEWESHLRDRVPERMRGGAFLARYGGTTDPMTTVDPEREYAVRQPTAHPIYEHARVQRFRALLESGTTTDAVMRELGGLMYASHASYGACGLGSEGTDRLVALVREAGPDAGLFGAKITGGGSGGTVAILGRPASRPAVEAIAGRYAQVSGRHAGLID